MTALDNKDSETPKADSLSATANKWQIRSTQVAIFVTLAGLVAGGIKYLNQRADSLETEKVQAANARRESQKPFLEKQLTTCFDTVGIVGSLAAENEPGVIVDPKRHANALSQFWLHYHGTLSVVESKDVEGAMVDIGNQLRGCEQKGTRCNLQANANRLAHACRDLVLARWDFRPIND
jgi:hypothetical protein